jgi:multidrug efflux pump subunit AcrA (membrane-fusion protein)
MATKYLLPGWLVLIGLSACNKNEPVTKPAYKMLTEAVYASGNLLPSHDYQLFTMADGYLGRRMVNEGDTVKAGQPLFLIESEIPDIRTRTARQTYRLAQSNYKPALAELEAGMATARERMQNDSINFARYQNLLAQNATSRIDFDRASLSYQTSRNEYQSWKQRYQKARNQLRMELENARSNYEISSQDQSNFVLKSRIDGLVYEVYKEEGETVRRQEAIARLGDSKKVYLQLNVDELDINKVKTGQEALVKIATYRDQVFKAKITKVYPMLNARDQTFRVDAEFTESSFPHLYAGLTVEANIIIHQKNQALTIPKAYLIGNDSVRIQQDGAIKTIRIRKGIENMEHVEVLHGLDTSTVLVGKD